MTKDDIDMELTTEYDIILLIANTPSDRESLKAMARRCYELGHLHGQKHMGDLFVKRLSGEIQCLTSVK